MEIRQKKMTCRVPPLKVTETGTNRSATYDFHGIHSTVTMWAYHTVAEKRQFRTKIELFSYPCVFNAPAEGFSPSNFVTADTVTLRKTKIMPITEGGKDLTICAFV